MFAGYSENYQKGQKLECPYKLNCLLKLMIIIYLL